MKYSELVIELSQRLAHESDYEDYEHEDCVKFINNFIKKEQD